MLPVRWTFSTSVMSCSVQGSQVLQAYSKRGLTNPMYAASFTAGSQADMLRLNRPSILFAFLVTSATCRFQRRSLVTVTLRYMYFVCVTDSMAVFWLNVMPLNRALEVLKSHYLTSQSGKTNGCSVPKQFVNFSTLSSQGTLYYYKN